MFKRRCKSVNSGDPLFSGNFFIALQNFDLNDDGLIDFDEFKDLNERYPMILHPAFRMQDKLQKHTLGEGEWVKVMANIKWHMDIRTYTEREGEPPKRGIVGKLLEQYFKPCFGHPAVDLEYLDSQSKMNQTDDSDEDEDDADAAAGAGAAAPPAEGS